MELKPGYKKTEVGVIPDDWKVSSLSELGDIRSGGTPSTSKSEFWDGGIPWCTPTDITSLKGRKYLQETSRTLSDKGLRSSSAEIIPTRSLIMTSRATIGECAINVLPMTTNQGFKNIVPFDCLNIEYLYYVMTTQKSRLVSLCGGSTFLEIGKKQLSSFQIQLPKSRAEQIAIADALSDIDALLESLQQLITKKRSIKQAAMQELLTGKTRLPGFDGEWEVKKIGELSRIGRGRVISHMEILKSSNPTYPVFSSQTSNSGIMGYLDSYDFEGDYVTWTTDGANAGTVFARSGRFNCTNVCGTIKPHDSDHHFLAAALGRVSQPHVSRHLGNPKLMNDVMKKIEVMIPKTREEQAAIATVLSDMDAEINALEQRWKKTRDIKQAMMQELLTGKTRLL